jgi:hypothetical protein
MPRKPAETREEGASAKILPFAPIRRGVGEPQQHSEEEREDRWLLIALVAAFGIAVFRLVYAVRHGQQFELEASLALVVVLGVPFLLREPVVNLVERASAWIGRRSRRRLS